jgi:hypothetical protein
MAVFETQFEGILKRLAVKSAMMGIQLMEMDEVLHE